MKRHVAALLAIVFLAGLETPQGAPDTVTPFAAVRPVLALPGASLGALAPSLPVAAPAVRVVPDVSVPATHQGAREGTWAYANASHGPRYLAIPEGPGLLVTVCGPADCLDRVSTDAGPELYLQRRGRIGDLSSVDFETVCGVPRSAGLCPGSYVIIHGAATLPPTDVLVEVLGEGPRLTAPPTDR